MQIINKFIRKLSQIFVDVDKDWGGYRITNIGAPTTAGDALRKGTRLTLAEMPDMALDKIMVGQGAGADPVEQDKPSGIPGLTVIGFRVNAATGTFTSTPERINDGLLDFPARANAVGQYAEVVLPNPMKISQYRQYGNTNNVGDGVWKLQYKDCNTQWNDWITGVGVRATADWSGWASNSVVVATAIRLVCTTVDSQGNNWIVELEVKF